MSITLQPLPGNAAGAGGAALSTSALLFTAADWASHQVVTVRRTGGAPPREREQARDTVLLADIVPVALAAHLGSLHPLCLPADGHTFTCMHRPARRVKQGDGAAATWLLLCALLAACAQ